METFPCEIICYLIRSLVAAIPSTVLIKLFHQIYINFRLLVEYRDILRLLAYSDADRVC
jgi:hypothetical protein